MQWKTFGSLTMENFNKYYNLIIKKETNLHKIRKKKFTFINYFWFVIKN